MSLVKHKPIMVKRAGDVSGDINVTPLIDVVLVLLIIFMVLTPLLEKDLPIQVPSTETEAPSNVPTDQLLVNVTGTGDITLNGTPVNDRQDLVDKLRAKLDGRQDADKLVFITADDDAIYGKVIVALDASKAAGAKFLGVATEDPPQTPP